MADRPVRVLHVLDVVSHGSGVSAVVMNLLRHTDPGRYRLHVAAHKPGDRALVEEITRRGGGYHPLPDITLTGWTGYRRAVDDLLRQEAFPVLHGHIPNAAFLYLRAAKGAGVPVRIAHAHNPLGADTPPKQLRNRALDWNIGRWANRFVACSDPAARYLFRGRAGEADILPNAIDPERFAFSPPVRQETRRALGLAPHTLCIGHVGRLAPQKNHPFLIRAFALLHKSRPDSVLLLAGEGPERTAIEAMVREGGLAGAVRLLGVRRDVERLYQAFDQFWLPSRFEGWGLVGLEAQAAGLPCLLSQAVPREIRVDDSARYLPIRDPAQWAGAALALAEKGAHRVDKSPLVGEGGLDIASQARRLTALYDRYLDEII